MTENQNRWHHIDALFTRALEVDAASREAFLSEHCADDSSILKAVRELLLVDDAADQFMEGVVSIARDQVWVDALGNWKESDWNESDWNESDWQANQDQADGSRIGEQLGAYKLTEIVGRGGNASVYLGERVEGEWRQRAAVKVLRRGIDTDDVVARFFAERQILSSLQHPNIAQLLDGGTTDDGLPYLIMEYVDGQTITEYCDNQRMDIKARLRVFLSVASAVEYAQQHLVVHRDLKPSNILVDDDGQVKLLDFGIAKLLAPEAMPGTTPQTRTGYRPLTPRYASPEQIRGETITTASDVYQLGLLLIELLTGCAPSSQPHGDYLLKSEDNEDTVKPSTLLSSSPDADQSAQSRSCSVGTLRRALRGDLDTIAMFATQPDPDRRYISATPLIADIQRYLAKQPIAAHRDSFIYRSGRFVRRHPFFVPASLILVIVTAVYGWTLSEHAAELEVERNLAQIEAERARLVKSLLVGIFQSPNPYQPASETSGKDITVREALKLGMQRLDAELTEQPAVSAELQGAVADVLSSLDDAQAAYDLRAATLAIETQLYGEHSADTLNSMRKLGDLALTLGKNEEATELLEEQLLRVRKVYGSDHEQVADSLGSLGWLNQSIGRLDTAKLQHERAVEIYRSLTPAPQEKLATSLSALAGTISTLGDSAAAIPFQQESLAIRRALSGPESVIVAETQGVLARIVSNANDYERALPLFEESLRVMEAKLGADHNGTLSTRNNLALTLSGLGRHADAEQQLRKVLASRLQKNGQWHQETAAATQNLAAILVRQGKYSQANEYLLQAHEVYQQILSQDHYLIAFPLLTRAFVQLQLDDPESAEQSAIEATRILRVALPVGHYATGMGVCRWGQALARQGKYGEARPLLERSVSLAEHPQMPSEYRAECREALARLYESTGEAAAARKLRGH